MQARPRRLPDWRLLPAPNPALAVSVIVPVKDEARRLPAALRALAAQRELDGTPFDPARFEVIVLANNCSDASADTVRRFAARHPRLALHVVEVEFPAAVAHVGHARACLMNEACKRLRRSAGAAGVIASTDGDTRVAPDWLAATLAEIGAGADAVGGRIVVDDDVPAPPGLRTLARRDETYQRLRVRLEHALDPDAADPWPRHHQHFGASLAITVAAYQRVGGLPAEPFLEDAALYRELCRHDQKVRHSERITVVTSSRRHGRVAIGLSQQLSEWAAQAAARETPHVADPQAWARRIAVRRRLRRLWLARAATTRDAAARASHARRLDAIALALALPSAWLRRCWRRADTFGAVWHDIETRLAGSRRHRQAEVFVPMAEAIVAQRALLKRHQAGRASRTGRADRSRGARR